MPAPLIPGLPFADGVLAAMITPAVLITACGTLTVSTSNRLGRVVDRVRKVIAEAEGFDPARLPAGRLGVGIMRERAETVGARLEVGPRGEKGTEVLMTWRDAAGGAYS